MNHQISVKFKSIVVVIILAVFGLLILWEHNNGGVAVHYLLHRADLPGISNWWGFLLLPIVTIITLFDIEKRQLKNQQETSKTQLKKSLTRFGLATLFGIITIILFLNESVFLGYLFLALPVLALFIPLYYTEYWLGFVLGTMYGFGVFIPFIFGALYILIFWILHQIVSWIKGVLKR